MGCPKGHFFAAQSATKPTSFTGKFAEASSSGPFRWVSTSAMMFLGFNPEFAERLFIVSVTSKHRHSPILASDDPPHLTHFRFFEDAVEADC
jgi:hypothetical protein